jgi:O-antigen/teichoic acid export membrane protein
VHIWTGVFVFLGVVSGYQMTYEHLNIIKMRRSAFGALANVGLNLILIPRLGGVGSAVSTLIVQAIVAYGVDLLNVRTRHIFWMKTHAYFLGSLFDGSVFRSRGNEAA